MPRPKGRSFSDFSWSARHHGLNVSRAGGKMKAGIPSRQDAASARDAASAGLSGPVIDVSALIEARPFGWYAAKLILVCWLVTFFDGYDMNVFAYITRYLGPAYHLDKVWVGYASS